MWPVAGENEGPKNRLLEILRCQQDLCQKIKRLRKLRPVIKSNVLETEKGFE